MLLPGLNEMVFPPVGARSGNVLAPRVEQPDITVRFDEFLPGARVPADAQQMAHFAGAIAAPDLLNGVIKGNVVLRLAGRAFELFVLGDRQPASLEDMIRYIANRRQPAAEGVALVQVAILPQDDPPVPGVFIVAEWGGEYVESWAPLVFPEGQGSAKIEKILWKGARPVPEGGRWLGVDPMVLFDLGPLGHEA